MSDIVFKTDNLTEGTNNKYFTNSRARSAISLDNNGSEVLKYNNINGKLTYTPLSNDKITSKINLGTGISLIGNKLDIGQDVKPKSDVKFNKVTASSFSGINSDMVEEKTSENNKFFTIDDVAME